MTRSVTFARSPLGVFHVKREHLQRLAALKVTANKEQVLLRLLAWDAQIAQLRSKYSPRLSDLPRQTSLTFGSRSEWTPNRNRWPTSKKI